MCLMGSYTKAARSNYIAACDDELEGGVGRSALTDMSEVS